MREGIKTSLLSILCVAATAAAPAAPAVRSIGGTGTYESAASAANATASSRAGSLRATGGFIRPTASISTSGATPKVATPTSTASGTTTMGGSVSMGGGTVGRVASTPRLSIGKYVGAPKSISSSAPTTSDLDTRIDRLERDVSELQTDKQDALVDTTYITVSGNELILDVEKIREDLDLKDGREVEVDADNDEGVKTRYIARDGEEQEPWDLLISWEDLRKKLSLEQMDADISQSIANLRTEIMNRITQLEQRIDADLSTKVDKNQFHGDEHDSELVGRAMVVGADGTLAPTGEFVTPNDLDNMVDGLGALAYKDTVSTADIDADSVTTEKLANTAVEREKLAAEIVSTLDQVTAWENWWNENKPGEGDYVMSVTADGTRQWFRVITGEEDTNSGGSSGGNSGGTSGGNSGGSSGGNSGGTSGGESGGNSGTTPGGDSGATPNPTEP